MVLTLSGGWPGGRSGLFNLGQHIRIYSAIGFGLVMSHSHQNSKTFQLQSSENLIIVMKVINSLALLSLILTLYVFSLFHAFSMYNK